MTITPPTHPATAPSERRQRFSWLGYGRAQLDPRRNGLNLVRLLLACTVLVGHGWVLSGTGTGPLFDGDNIGTWAVFGFFAVSGYLITGSRFTNSLGEYLVHRIARIFPAFLVCLVLIATVFAPIGYHSQHGTIDGFLTTATTPLNFVFANSLLRVNAFDVAATPSGIPYPGAWDGSLWSLYYEFLCYLIVAGLASLTWIRRSPWGLGIAFLASVAVHANMSVLMPYLGNNADFALLFKLLPFFLAGGFVQVIRSGVVFTWPGAAAGTVLTVGLVELFGGWGPQLAAPLIAYVILWFGAVVPTPTLVRRHDISYGMYIYTFPIQQLLAFAGLHQHGLVLYDLVTATATLPLAIGSWLLIERPVMRRVRRSTARAVVSNPVAPAQKAAPLHSSAAAAGEPAATLR